MNMSRPREDAAGRVREQLSARLMEVYGVQLGDQVLESMTAPKQLAYWENPLRPSEAELPGRPLDGVAGMRLLDGVQAADFAACDPVVTGSWYIMNPSSAWAADQLGVHPDQEVLDLAAAPGGKTLLLAAGMANQGRIAAVDSVRSRFHRMRANLERCGVTIADFYLADGRGIGRKVPERFDAVLLDAPCSSEARIRWDDASTYAHWKPRKLKETSRKQRALIRSAFAALKPGGTLLYCTCSFAPEENELVVQRLLDAEPSARPMALAAPPVAWMPGITSWRKRVLDESLVHAVRILPDAVWDGFFACLLKKLPGEASSAEDETEERDEREQRER